MNELFIERLDEIFLLEEVFGKLAFVYHRTHTLDVVKNIIKNSFRVGPEALYGYGIYTTYELESQFNIKMNEYGDYLVKSKANLGVLLCFDYNISKKVHGKNYTLVNQLVNVFKIFNKYEEIPREILITSTLLNTIGDKTTADYVHNIILNNGIKNKIGGVLFYGKHDGHVAVFYKTSNLYPFAYSLAPTNVNPENIKWTSVENLEKLNIHYSQTLGDLSQLGKVPYENSEAELQKWYKERDWNKVPEHAKNDKDFTLNWWLEERDWNKIPNEIEIWYNNDGYFNGNLTFKELWWLEERDWNKIPNEIKESDDFKSKWWLEERDWNKIPKKIKESDDFKELWWLEERDWNKIPKEIRKRLHPESWSNRHPWIFKQPFSYIPEELKQNEDFQYLWREKNSLVFDREWKNFPEELKKDDYRMVYDWLERHPKIFKMKWNNVPEDLRKNKVFQDKWYVIRRNNTKWNAFPKEIKSLITNDPDSSFHHALNFFKFKDVPPELEKGYGGVEGVSKDRDKSYVYARALGFKDVPPEIEKAYGGMEAILNNSYNAHDYARALGYKDVPLPVIKRIAQDNIRIQDYIVEVGFKKELIPDLIIKTISKDKRKSEWYLTQATKLGQEVPYPIKLVAEQ